MKLPRRNFLHLAAGAAALPAVALIARAQTYPSRPVRIIVPFPAGQATDTIARLVGQSLSERLGQPFVIENRTGAGGNIGTESVVRATPDGYTLLLVGLSNAMNATLYKKLNFNFIRDIAPVASIGGALYVMVVNPSVPAKTVPEFIAYAKANPGKINMGSSGSGSVSHVFGERGMQKVRETADLLQGPVHGLGRLLDERRPMCVGIGICRDAPQIELGRGEFLSQGIVYFPPDTPAFFVLQARHFDLRSRQRAHSGDHTDLALGVVVRLAVLQIDDPDQAPAAHQRHG